MYLESFGKIVHKRFEADYHAGTGFYEINPSKRKPIIRIACPNGILIPFIPEEIQEGDKASEIIDSYFELAKIFREFRAGF